MVRTQIPWVKWLWSRLWKMASSLATPFSWAHTLCSMRFGSVLHSSESALAPELTSPLQGNSRIGFAPLAKNDVCGTKYAPVKPHHTTKSHGLKAWQIALIVVGGMPSGSCG